MLKTGQAIDGRYEVLALLGEGGMGAVFHVRHQRLGCELALKELTLGGPGAEAQFLEEARILARLDHPHLPRVRDYFECGTQQYLVMDYVPGDDLQTLLDRRARAFGPEDVRGWVLQLLDALGYIHARGVVHRDVKPANLKVTPAGKLVLVDFGIAKDTGSLRTPGRTSFHAHAAYTPHLAAPEQVGGRGTGPRTDLYAVASTFAYLLSNQLPPDPRAIAAPWGPWLARAMAPDPAGRWPDAPAMARALGAAGAAPGSRRDIRR